MEDTAEAGDLGEAMEMGWEVLNGEEIPKSAEGVEEGLGVLLVRFEESESEVTAEEMEGGVEPNNWL